MLDSATRRHGGAAWSAGGCCEGVSAYHQPDGISPAMTGVFPELCSRYDLICFQSLYNF